MVHSQWDIVILKPTFVFLSFLASQFPELELPELSVLQLDNTAYAIPAQESDEATLDEIERYFPIMFQHEINRCLGYQPDKEIDASFLDFLCCFKFEWHSQIILMESMMISGHSLMCVKPRSQFLKWIKSSWSEQADGNTVVERVNVSHLSENTTVLVKQLKQLSDVQPFMQRYYKAIFKAEMLRMCLSVDEWPEVNSYEAFDRYFSVSVHSQLICLA